MDIVNALGGQELLSGEMQSARSYADPSNPPTLESMPKRYCEFESEKRAQSWRDSFNKSHGRAGGAVGPFAFPVVPGLCTSKEQPKTNNWIKILGFLN